MEGRVTCNEEKCQQSQINIDAPTTTSSPVTPISSRINADVFEEKGEKGIIGNVGPSG